MSKRSKVIVWVLVGLISLSAQAMGSERLPQALRNILGPTDALLVRDAGGKTVYAWREDQKMVPASTLKLLTSLAALETLGPSFRFVTEFYANDKGYLKMKGYGDPLLISEVLDAVAVELVKKGNTFQRLMLDDTYFTTPVITPGAGSSSNPYDAPPGALCANFNSIDFVWGPHHLPLSSEPQTPLIPFSVRIIGSRKLPAGRVLLTQNQGEATLYAGNLFAFFWEKNGGNPFREVVRGYVAPNDSLYFKAVSPYTLEDVVQRCLKFSNNFIANQMFLAMGAHAFGAPATLEQGARMVRDYAADNLRIPGVVVEDGSGLSRKNRITASQMMQVLNRFSKYRRLMPEKDGVLYKTGTLTGVSALAGYVTGPKDSVDYTFAIISNTRNRSAKKIMSVLLREMGRGSFNDGA